MPWLNTGWIWEQFGRGQQQAQKAFRQFVEEGIRGKESPWDHVKGQIYLGSEGFLEEVQKRVKREEDPEIPQVQKRPRFESVEELLKRVAGVYGVRVEEIVKPTRRPSEARQIGLYVSRRVAGLGLKAIGERFEMGYTGVSRRVGAVEERL
jgi:hypothetical protein